MNSSVVLDDTDKQMEILGTDISAKDKHHSIEEVSTIERSYQNLGPFHCLICNSSLLHTDSIQFNVFGKFKSDKGESRVTVFEKVGLVLCRDLSSINLHSEIVCQRCFNLLVEYEATEIKLQLLRTDFICKFDKTANLYQECASESHEGNTQDENYHKDKLKEANKSKKLFIINEEGKLVDENGKERLDPLHKHVDNGKSEGVKRKSITKDVTSKTKNRYVCCICGKGFRAFSHRVEHMLIHLGEKPWSCKDCKKTFRTKSALKVHSTKHSGERPFTCQECGKSFSDKSYFDEHCRVHLGQRPFVCVYCRRQFSRKKDLVIHTKTHTGDKPHACTVCSKTFAVKSRLDRHMRIHSGEKPYSCEYCYKSFARKDDYKVHVRQHTGERPFGCSFCKKTFTNQSNCLAHVRTHTGGKSHSCNTCNLTFSRKLKLEKHLAEKHSASENRTVDILPPAVTEVVVPLEGESQPVASSSILHAEAIQSIDVTSLHTLQTLPVSQVAQVSWSDNLDPGTTTTTYVNLVPGTYVNIIN